MAHSPRVSTPPVTSSITVVRIPSSGSASGIAAGQGPHPSPGTVQPPPASGSSEAMVGSTFSQQPPSFSPSASYSNVTPRSIPVPGASAADPSLGASTSTVSPPLASPGGGTSGAPASPSASNRFGITLGGVFNRANRPRGFTITRERGGMVSPGARGGRSPAYEEPNSPGALEGNSSGGEDRRASYFPSIMRQSRRRLREDSAGGGGNESSDAGAASAGAGSMTPRGRNKKSHSHRDRDVSAPALLGEASNANGTSSQSSTEEQNLGGQLAGGSELALGDTLSQPRNVPNSNSGSASTPLATNPPPVLHYLRLVPHLDSTRSLHFHPIERKVKPGSTLKVGRFTDRNGPGNNGAGAQDHNDPRIAFKSKVVSRGHADIFTDANGSFFIKDTKSSSGTFLNHIRLSGPGNESRPFPLRDGDVLQLGVDYQGGTEEMYRCVKMRVELNRDWQRAQNNFNKSAMAQLRALGGGSEAPPKGKTKAAAGPKPAISAPEAGSIADCCICLFSVTVCQALFIAPCSHVYHYKCIRPLLQMHHPGFSCPLCRTFADLEADVETEEPMYVVDEEEAPEGSKEEEEVMADREPSVGLAADNALNDATPGVERTEHDVFATLRAGSRSRSAAASEIVGAGDPPVPSIDDGPARGTDSPRRTSVIVSGPHGVGVPFAVSPAAGNRSRPGSVRSVALSPMSRRQREGAASILSSDEEDDGDVQLPDIPQSPQAGNRATMFVDASELDISGGDNEDSEMREAEGDASASTVEAPSAGGPPLLPTPVVMGGNAAGATATLFSAIRAAAHSAAQPFLAAGSMDVDDPAATSTALSESRESPRRTSEGSSGASSLGGLGGSAAQGEASTRGSSEDDKVVKVGAGDQIEAPAGGTKVVGSAADPGHPQPAS